MGVNREQLCWDGQSGELVLHAIRSIRVTTKRVTNIYVQPVDCTVVSYGKP